MDTLYITDSQNKPISKITYTTEQRHENDFWRALKKFFALLFAHDQTPPKSQWRASDGGCFVGGKKRRKWEQVGYITLG